MAATTADREAKRADGRIKAYPVKASTKIYKGTLVGVDANGWLVSMSDTAGLIYTGVAFEGIDNSSGSNGDKKCRVEKTGEYEFAYAGGDATQANVGDEVYAQDNQTVDEDASLTTNDYKVGVVTEYVTAAKLRVRIDGYVR